MNWHVRWVLAQLTITAIVALVAPLVFRFWRIW